MKPTREQILANRHALTQALSEDRITRWLNGADSAAAWAQFKGFSPRGARASFDFVHDMGRPRFRTVGELMPFERVVFHVGSDASFRTYRCSWSSANAFSDEDRKTVAKARREILVMFSPDGQDTESETVAFLDDAFGTVRQAALAHLHEQDASQAVRSGL